MVPLSLEMARAKSLRGIALFELGRGAESLESLRECQTDFSKLSGPNSATTSLFSLNLALVLERSRRIDQALAVVNQAEPVLREAMGLNAPTYLRVKSIQDRLAHTKPAVLSGESVSVPREVGGASQRKLRSIDFFS